MKRKKKSNFFSGCLLQLVISPLLLASLPSSLFAQEVDVYTNLGLTGGQILDIAIDPSNPDKMFAASHLGDGLFITTDGGINFSSQGTSLEENHYQDIHFIDENNGMVVGWNNSILKTTNAGGIWEKVDIGLDGYQYYGVHMLQANIVILIGYNTYTQEGVIIRLN